jgi:hypothetical protein
MFERFKAIEQEIKDSKEVQQSNNYEDVAKATTHEQDI